MMSLAAIAAWRITGERRFFAAPLFPLIAWAAMRAMTPADGMVVQKLSSLAKPETARFLLILLLWLLIGVAGLIAHGLFRPPQAYPDAFMVVGAPSGW